MVEIAERNFPELEFYGGDIEDKDTLARIKGPFRAMVVWTKVQIQGRSARAGLIVIFPITVYIVEASISSHAVGFAFAIDSATMNS